MKVLINIIKGYFGFLFLLTGIVGVIVGATNKFTFRSIEDFLLWALTCSLLLFFSYKLLRKDKATKKEIHASLMDKTTKNSSIKKEPDIDILRVENLNRIARESIEIANKTSKPDIFFSRFDLAVDKSSSKDKAKLINSYEDMTREFLYRFSNEVINKLLSLKTVRAKENNLSKFDAALEPYTSRISHENKNILDKMKVEWEQYLESKTPEKDMKLADYPKKNVNIEGITTTNVILTEANTVISINNQSFDFPSDIFELLWFQNGPFANIGDTSYSEIDLGMYKVKFKYMSSEPSALDVNFPIEIGEDNEDLGYYPSYEKLTPKQRWKYINWLKDIETPIEIGYVFIFYYGLERHLFTSKIDKAVDMIFRLQDSHRSFKSKSFDAYSSDALLIASLINRNSTWLKRIDPERLSSLPYASVKGITEGCFSSEDVIRFSKFVGWNNNRYIKSNHKLFLETLESILLKKYGNNFYMINREDYKLVNKSTPLVLANYSLKFKDRKLDIPDILSLPKVKKDLHNLLEETHETVKNKLKELRKQENKRT